MTQIDLRSLARSLLSSQRGRASERSLLSPDAPRHELEALGRELLADYADSLAARSERRAGRLWIFAKRTDDLELYTQALARLLERAEEKGRREGIMVATDDALDEDCACRCRAHRKTGCRICLRTEACPVHGDDE